jgi:hypothetical protein
MNKQTKKIYIKWVENWIKIHWPQMQRVSLEELKENEIQDPETVVSWTTSSGAHITFYKDYKIDGLIFEPTPCDSEEGGLQIPSMPDSEREFREIMDNYLKEEGLCIDDVGRVFRVKNMKWARALINPKEEILHPDQEPKKYTNVLYVVSSGDGTLYQINNHLIAQKKISKNATLTCAYFLWQNFTNGTYSKDLFHPIKHGFSGYFTHNDYYIWDFSVASTPF